MRAGYSSLVAHHGICAIRRVRGDNYCAIRSVVHQLLCHHPLALRDASSDFKTRVRTLQATRPGLLQQWSFAGRIAVNNHEILSKITECHMTLMEEADVFIRESSTNKRFDMAFQLFSSGERELRVLEAVKVLMLRLCFMIFSHISCMI